MSFNFLYRLSSSSDRSSVEQEVEASAKRSKVSRERTARNASFLLFTALTFVFFWVPLSTLIRFSFEQEQYSHIILVPVVSAFLIFRERRRIFCHIEPNIGEGLGLLFAGILSYWFGQRKFPALSENDQLTIAILSVVTIWVAGFILCYGTPALRASLFPLLFLLLMVPIPDFFLSRAVFWLQKASAEVSYALFQFTGVPVYREGFVFSLSGVDIEIAKECSGIRSSIALFITSLLAGYLFLRSRWRRVVLTLAIFPLLIVKNGFRIVTLTLLATYVDSSFLTGNLHRKGGILFFVLALVFLAPVLWVLQRSEAVSPGQKSGRPTSRTEGVVQRMKGRLGSKDARLS